MIIKEICELGVEKYNSLPPIKKFEALTYLVEAIYELSSFKGHLQGLIERQLEKAREKSKLVEKMKNEEVDLRCLEEKTNQLKADVKNHEEIKKKLSRIEGQKKDQEILETRKTLDQNVTKIFQIENKIEKIRKEYKDCNINAKFLTHPNTLLGYDIDHNQYWFFVTDNSKLFIKTMKTENVPS